MAGRGQRELGKMVLIDDQQTLYYHPALVAGSRVPNSGAHLWLPRVRPLGRHEDKLMAPLSSQIKRNTLSSATPYRGVAMGTSYGQLCLKERIEIYRLLADGKSLNFIATRLGRRASTISRELKRTSQTLAQLARRIRPRTGAGTGEAPARQRPQL